MTLTNKMINKPIDGARDLNTIHCIHNNQLAKLSELAKSTNVGNKLTDSNVCPFANLKLTSLANLANPETLLIDLTVTCLSRLKSNSRLCIWRVRPSG